MWSNPAFLFLQEPLVYKQLSLITKISLRDLDDSQVRDEEEASVKCRVEDGRGANIIEPHVSESQIYYSSVWALKLLDEFY